MIFEREDRLQSPLEKRFLEDCATVGLLVEPQFEVNGIHADFGIPQAKLVIECDSKEWHSTDKSNENDAKRNVIYAAAGFSVIRIKGEDIMRGGEIIAGSIRRIVQQDLVSPGLLIELSVIKNMDTRAYEIEIGGKRL